MVVVNRNRLMIPILDSIGNAVGFGGRSLPTNTILPKQEVAKTKSPAKYINSPNSKVFQKSKLLYGFNLAKPFIAALDQVIIVEGYFDVIR